MSDGNTTAERSGPGARTPVPKKGLAVTSLWCGLGALALCWAPLVNAVSIVAGLAAVGLGVGALVLVRRGLHQGQRRAITGVAAGAAAVIIAVLVDIVVGLALSGTSTDLGSPAAGRPGAAAGPKAPTASPAPDSTVTGSTTSLGGLPLGQSATVGDWTVAITSVDTDADDVIAQANSYNEPPTGRYVLVDVSVVYNGSGEGIAWVGLQSALQGNDARDYSTTTCPAVVPRPAFSQPQLRTGGRADYQVCFDLPADAISGGRIEVTQFLGVGDPGYWAVPA